MTDINVLCELDELDNCPFESKVYAIDIRRHQFLVVDMCGHFRWASTVDCTFINDKKNR